MFVDHHISIASPIILHMVLWAQIQFCQSTRLWAAPCDGHYPIQTTATHRMSPTRGFQIPSSLQDMRLSYTDSTLHIQRGILANFRLWRCNELLDSDQFWEVNAVIFFAHILLQVVILILGSRIISIHSVLVVARVSFNSTCHRLHVLHFTSSCTVGSTRRTGSHCWGNVLFTETFNSHLSVRLSRTMYSLQTHQSIVIFPFLSLMTLTTLKVWISSLVLVQPFDVILITVLVA